MGRGRRGCGDEPPEVAAPFGRQAQLLAALGSANRAVESADAAFAPLSARRRAAGRLADQAAAYSDDVRACRGGGVCSFSEEHLDGGISELTSWQGTDPEKQEQADSLCGQLRGELREALHEHRCALREASARHEASLRLGTEAALERLGAELAGLLRGLGPHDPGEALRRVVPAAPAPVESRSPDEHPGLPGAGAGAGGAGAKEQLCAAGADDQPVGEERPQLPFVARRQDSDDLTVSTRGAASTRSGHCGSPASKRLLGRERSLAFGSMPPGMFQQQVDGEDAGGSQFNRRLVSKFMERHASKGTSSESHFRFQGARKLKARLKWVRRKSFEHMMASIIIVNVIYLGAQTALFLSNARQSHDRRAHGDIGDVVDDSARWLWLIVDSIFAGIFLVEILLRICAYQLKFFFGSHRWWNAFDSFTCCATLTATLLDLVQVSPGFGVDLLKMLRLARTVRTLRSSRSKFFHTLKTLSYTIAGSANAFLSAILLLAIVILVFGVMFMQGLQSHLLLVDAGGDAKATERLLDFFGTFQDTGFTLLECVTGGMDWRDVSVALWSIGPLYSWFFALYIVFTVLCVLNILNGVFVNAAIESAQTNKELAIESTRHRNSALIDQMVQWFVEADKDRSGKVSWTELRNLLADESIRNFLQVHGIDVASAGQIFHLLDRKGNGELEPEEFVDNLITLQGEAKAIDLASLRALCEGISYRIADIEDRFDSMLSSRPPSSGASS